MSIDLSVIIPVYNESENVDDICKSLDEYLGTVPFSCEIVFVDDGSSDHSVALIKEQSFQNTAVKLVTLSRNFGSHAAMRAGSRCASSDNCMFYFMDMRIPEIIGEFYEKLREGYDIVYGLRGGYKESFASKTFSKLMRKHIAPDYPREGIGCFAFNGKVKAELNRNVETNSSIYLQLFNMGFCKAFVPYEAGEREKGVSKWTFRKKLKLFIDSYVAFSHTPIRAVTLLGMILAIVGIIYAIAIIIIKLFNIIPLAAGWPTLISVILICSGVTNLSIGVIAEYIWRTLDAARGRPVFIIDEEISIHEIQEKNHS
ncbi:MAG: glycosyltransferase [Christensenellaceae bacterium]|jgi:glycosyltransferase involved in cell wall biosynthesis